MFEEYTDGSCRFLGYDGCVIACHQNDPLYLGADKGTNGTAEITATGLATLWMLQSKRDRFHVGYDARYAEAMAIAIASPKTNKELVDNVAALRDTLDKRAHVASTHVNSHKGDP